MIGTSVIGTGFSHSAAINVKGLLYVWGDNKNSQLTSYLQGLVNIKSVYALVEKCWKAHLSAIEI